MNVSNFTLHHLALWLFILFTPILASAQGYQHFEIAQGEVFEYSFFSQYTPNPVPTASNGTIEIVTLPPNAQGLVEYMLKYTPDAGFIGLDSTDFVYSESLTPIQVFLEIEVVAFDVTANTDYLTITKNTIGTLDVLANDISNNGILVLENLPLINNCQLSVDANNQITVTPTTDFTGVARFHYSVCNDAGTCDVGLAVIFVEESGSSNDTITLVTKRNQALDVLIPISEGHVVIDAPDSGDLTASDAILLYTPDLNDVQTGDEFTCAYKYNGTWSLRTYQIKILEAPLVNNFALDDYAFTPIGAPVSIAVLENDLGENITYVNHTNPSEGSISEVNGILTYTPNSAYEGFDQFTYTVCLGLTNNCETGKVVIGVSDQEPESVTYDLTTAINTPLIINYDIPITAWDFEVSSGSTTNLEGEVVFHPGDYNEGDILGQSVNGYNLLIYTPPSDITGEDDFEINFCTDNGCKLVKIYVDIVEVPPYEADDLCVNDCVWSGDANSDGQVDMSDLLPIGYCIGKVGPSRTNGAVEWYGQFGEDWNGSIGMSPVNIKHVDTDGDGFISASDTAALGAFYSRRHSLTPKAIPNLSTTPLYFVPKTTNPQPGDLVQIDVVLGTEDFPAIDINGITFALTYNATIVEPGTMNVNFYQDSWMAYDSPTLSLAKIPFEGRLDAGYTRTINKAGSGSGVIGSVNFIIQDDIDGARPGETLRVNVNNAYAPVAMNGAGQYSTLATYDPTLFIKFEEQKETKKEDLLIAYPNPAQDVLNIHLNGDEYIKEVTMFTLTGQKIYESGQLGEEVDRHQIDVLPLMNNMYVVRVMTTDGMISKKVDVMREQR